MAVPPFGVYTPLVTYYHDDETLDLETVQKHALRMAESGVAGLVLQGSNGEAPHLLHEERKQLVRALRLFLNDKGYTQLKLIVGCGAPSVLESILHITEAKESGGDFALVLPPSYWTAAMTVPVIEQFFSDIAERSPLPLLIYNFPGVSGGIDISSDTILSLARKHPNKIVGAKLTCGNVGKLQRIAHPGPESPFAVFAGKSDFFLPGLVAGSNGVIAALANVVPKTHVKVLELYTAGKIDEAVAIQTKLSHADWALSKVGVAGVKAVILENFGYGTSKARRPLCRFDVRSLDVGAQQALRTVVDIENSLS